jgi:FkbM family methyltransferase
VFVNISFFNKKLRNISRRVFNKIENNGNCNFDENGEKVFIDNLFKYFTTDTDTKVIFDVGANVGEYSQMIEQKSLKSNIDIELHLFEPTKSCFDILLNKFGLESIVLNNFGLSDTNTTAKIFYDKQQSGLASLYQRNLDTYNLELNQSEEIKLKRLDLYINEKNINHINFLKIDIEGHELKAFEGFGDYLSGDFIDFIQFEYGGANLDSHSSLMDIYKLLESKGFEIAKIMPYGLELRKYQPFMDNFQYSNYIAISKRIVKKI